MSLTYCTIIPSSSRDNLNRMHAINRIAGIFCERDLEEFTKNQKSYQKYFFGIATNWLSMGPPAAKQCQCVYYIIFIKRIFLCNTKSCRYPVTVQTDTMAVFLENRCSPKPPMYSRTWYVREGVKVWYARVWYIALVLENHSGTRFHLWSLAGYTTIWLKSVVLADHSIKSIAPKFVSNRLKKFGWKTGFVYQQHPKKMPNLDRLELYEIDVLKSSVCWAACRKALPEKNVSLDLENIRSKCKVKLYKARGKIFRDWRAFYEDQYSFECWLWKIDFFGHSLDLCRVWILSWCLVCRKDHFQVACSIMIHGLGFRVRV